MQFLLACRMYQCQFNALKGAINGQVGQFEFVSKPPHVLAEMVLPDRSTVDPKQCLLTIYNYLIVIYCAPGYLSRYSNALRGGRSGDRIPLGVRFSALKSDLPWGPPTFMYFEYRVDFPGVK